VEWIIVFFCGWLVSYWFYRRHKNESMALSTKLSVDARRFLLEDSRESLGLTDIIQLFHEKIIDEHLDLLDGPFPYRRCPKCGSKRIRRFVFKPDGTPDVNHAPTTPPIAGEAFHILCRSCGYQDHATFGHDPDQENPNA
jgi:hypothetical protein